MSVLQATAVIIYQDMTHDENIIIICARPRAPPHTTAALLKPLALLSYNSTAVCVISKIKLLLYN